jgi:hypothetical protein
LADLTVPEVRRLLAVALPLPPRSVAVQLAWSCWRRKRRLQARRSHYRRRAALRLDTPLVLAHSP